MSKPKACKFCSMIYETEKCPNCESKEGNENFKGRIVLLNPEKSEIAAKLNLKSKGNFAIKNR